MATAVSVLGLMMQLTSNLREENNKTQTDGDRVKVIQPDFGFSCV
jgi:hypothetical protein